MIKKYKIGFDIWGLIIFIIIMIPNFIWYAVPVPNDILRGELNGYHKSAVLKTPIKKVEYDTVHKRIQRTGNFIV